MAKRKSRKKAKETKLEVRPEVYGLVLIILSILAYGPGKPLGWIGKWQEVLQCFYLVLLIGFL